MRGVRLRNLRKLIQDSSTFGAPLEDGKIGGDPFLTGPFAKGTKLSVYFDQGDNAAEESMRRKINPSDTSVIMFPGQGTQHVGMCGDTASMPRHVQVLYEIASSILNYDLLDLCANGPIDKLNKTVYSQPAILVSSLAALERLRDTEPGVIERCVVTAGFSIGEITALVFAGVLSFEDAIRVVKVRAEAMQLASEIVPSGMSTVLYGADSKLNYSLVVAKEWCKREFKIDDPVCSIANYLFPHCKVVAGHTEALDFLEANYKDFNLRRVKRLPVSGAFHTS
ncbi:putative malonyl-CoA-acyl carrier protein transacylase, mitochondrial [Orchesella cincta]|uniref:[acyl-carrier-protein] S-malonyltransferase n=1 Tax=Orchesella cincta TaxID=48709 RepID=A0A1D2NLD9_ORCCI|nr:putative malonyl-CoA-acyl carrier protein transacylase, mitochondrial [Orchesella cincta]